MDRAEFLERTLGGSRSNIVVETWDLENDEPVSLRVTVPFKKAAQISGSEVFWIPSNGVIRAVVSDSDDRETTIAPSVKVETSLDRFDSYWWIEEAISPKQFETLLSYLDPLSPPRTTQTFRMPGTTSTKHGEPFTARVVDATEHVYSLAQIYGLALPAETVPSVDPAWLRLPGPFEAGNMKQALLWLQKQGSANKALGKGIRALLEKPELSPKSLMQRLVRAGLTEREAIWCAEAAMSNPFKHWRYGVREELAKMLLIGNVQSGAASIATRIHDIRAKKTKDKPFVTRDKMARKALEDFEENAVIANATDGTRWAVDRHTGTAMELVRGSEPIMHYIMRRYGINPVDQDHRHLIEEMVLLAASRPPTTEATAISWFDRDTNKMMVSFGGREVAVLAPEGVSMQENGSSGVIFKPVPRADLLSTKLIPVDRMLQEAPGSWWDRLLPLEHLANLTRGKPEEASALLHVWTLFFLFRNIAASRPILISGGPMGSGKCLGLGTKVLKYDGTVSVVEDIKTGDLLMGPDSSPRRVLSTTVGEGPLYRIVPLHGNPWVCNEDHLLTIVRTATNKVSDVTVRDWMKYPSYIQQQTKLFSPYDGVDFHSSRATLPIDPYFLGVWLGDGTKHIRGKNSVVAITKDDIEIKECCEREAERWGLHTKTYYRYENNRDGSTRIVGDKGKKNPLLSTLRAIPELPDGIPLQYLTASREDRKALLAGLIDTDGHVSGGCADIIQKRKGLADGIAFLSRSLGFHVYESLKYVKGYTDPYFRCSISGNLSSLPMRIARKQAQPRKSKKNHNRRGFTVEPLGVGAYYGFTLDGEDGRFLLGDLTVTHNTTFSKKLHLLFYGRGVKLFGVKNNQSDWTTTVSNYPLALFDNVDAPTPWWLPAALAVSITPMDATKRSLYSNNTPYTARMDAMVGLSSHDGSFLKEDIIDRGILIQCRRIEEDERLEEQPMLDAILRDREELLGGLMADVIHVLRTPRPEAAKGSAIRIVDFNAIGGWIARGIGKEQEFHSAIGTLSIHQKAKVLEEDITLVMALEDMQRVSPLATEWATHTQIWTELISLADDNGEALRSQYKNGHLFGRKLLAIATQLRDSIGLQMQDDPARGWKVFKVSGYNSGKKKGSRSAE